MKIENLEKELKETSYSSSHNCYMTDSKMKVIDFDEFKNQYGKKYKLKVEEIKSNDVLFINGDKYFFIEFKNGKINNQVVFDLQKKIYDSLLIFCDYFSKSLKDTREKMEYILVYNEKLQHTGKFDEKSDEKINSALMQFANSESIKFGLRNFVKYCFKNVHTYSKEEFEEKFVKKYEKKKN